MGLGSRGPETVLANRTAGRGAGPAGVVRPHVRGNRNIRSQTALVPGVPWVPWVLGGYLGSAGLRTAASPGRRPGRGRSTRVRAGPGPGSGSSCGCRRLGGERRRRGPGPGLRPLPAPGPARTLTRLGGRDQEALRIQPIEAAEARRGGGLVRPVQVAVVPEAACEKEEPPKH